jgi:hypothetical protein
MYLAQFQYYRIDNIIMSNETYVYKEYYKSIKEIPQKYRPKREEEIGPDGKEKIVIIEESPQYAAWVLERANNLRNNEEEAKFEAKRQEKERQKMREYEEKQRKDRERLQEYYRNLPEKQLQMFLSGQRNRCGHCRAPQLAEFFGHAKNCPYYHTMGGHDIEPGLQLLKKEYSKGKIIRLDGQTHNRLVEFAIPDEDPVDLINRLLDIASEAQLEATH